MIDKSVMNDSIDYARSGPIDGGGGNVEHAL